MVSSPHVSRLSPSHSQGRSSPLSSHTPPSSVPFGDRELRSSEEFQQTQSNVIRPRTAVLFGLMGEGKSAVANLLLNSNEFPVSSSQSGGTKFCRIETARAFDGRELRVVDLPGVNETRPAIELPTLSPQGVAPQLPAVVETMFWSSISEAFKCIGETSGDGVDAFLLVIRCSSRITEESVKFWEALFSDNFGSSVWSRVVLVLTFVDQLLDEGKGRRRRREGGLEQEGDDESEDISASRKMKEAQQQILRSAKENPSFGKLLRRASARCVCVDASTAASWDVRSFGSASLLNQIRAVRVSNNFKPYELNDFQKAQDTLWKQRSFTFAPSASSQLFHSPSESSQTQTAGAIGSAVTNLANELAQQQQLLQRQRQGSGGSEVNPTDGLMLFQECQARREGYERAMRTLVEMSEQESHLMNALQLQLQMTQPFRPPALVRQHHQPPQQPPQQSQQLLHQHQNQQHITSEGQPQAQSQQRQALPVQINPQLPPRQSQHAQIPQAPAQAQAQALQVLQLQAVQQATQGQGSRPKIPSRTAPNPPFTATAATGQEVLFLNRHPLPLPGNGNQSVPDLPREGLTLPVGDPLSRSRSVSGGDSNTYTWAEAGWPLNTQSYARNYQSQVLPESLPMAPIAFGQRNSAINPSAINPQLSSPASSDSKDKKNKSGKKQKKEGNKPHSPKKGKKTPVFSRIFSSLT